MMKDFVDVVFKAQVAFYLKNGIKPIDVYLGRNDLIRKKALNIISNG